MSLSSQYNAAHLHVRGRERRKRNNAIRLLVFVLILALSALITFLLGGWEEEAPPTVDAIDTGTAHTILAALPMQEGATSTGTDYAPALDVTEVQAYDASVIRQPETGQVNLEYFADAAFLGDSITEGFSDYSINLGGALICGYTGIGPNNVVNETTQTHSERGEEVIIDVLVENDPAKVYILLGSNTLVSTGNDESFLAYYEAMIDLLYERLGEDTILYVQSVPPVTEAAALEKEGLASERLQSINESLAQLAAEKGAVYIDLWEVLADEDGNLREECAAPDGIHFDAADGYTSWVNYLRTHTLYDADSPWTAGSTFAS